MKWTCDDPMKLPYEVSLWSELGLAYKDVSIYTYRLSKYLSFKDFFSLFYYLHLETKKP